MAKQKYENYTREQLLEEVKKLSKRKKYGLVWEEETTKEKFEKEAEGKLPVLVEDKKKEVKTDDDKPVNILIEGDNYHALSVLNYTHPKSIDVIYIDPPYNTGNNDFKYNDRFVDGEDTFRHSKWLAFMSKRLKLAKNLLKDTGVLLISIDDNEQANLKLLCDDIFGENNFVANIIWRGGKRNAAKYISTSHEYICFYAKSIETISRKKISWKVRKSGLDEIYKQYDKLKKSFKTDYSRMSEELKNWFKSLPSDSPAKDHEHYCWIDEKGIYFASDISRGGGGGPQWEIKNPFTGKVVNTPARGWAFSKKEDLLQAIKDEKVHFNGSSVPCFKRYLKENESTILDTIFYKDRRAASLNFRDIMGDGVFDFPKDHEIISYYINALSPSNGVILDFFAGSGTTGQSVLELNNRGNNFQFILCTNNENDIATEVCYPRINKNIKGYTSKRGKKIEGLGGNLKYYKTNFVGSEPSHRNKKLLTEKSIEMLCIKENTFNEELGKKDYFIFSNKEKYTAILFDEMKLAEFKKEISKLKKRVSVYVFSIDGDDYREEFENMKIEITLCAIPEAILKVYRRIYLAGQLKLKMQ